MQVCLLFQGTKHIYFELDSPDNHNTISLSFIEEKKKRMHSTNQQTKEPAPLEDNSIHEREWFGVDYKQAAKIQQPLRTWLKNHIQILVCRRDIDFMLLVNVSSRIDSNEDR